MISLVESILSKKPTDIEINSDTLKSVIYQTPVKVPVFERNWLDKWEFDLKGSTILVCKLISMVTPTIYFDDNTIDKLKDLGIKEIEFDTPTFFYIELDCKDCNKLKFTNMGEDTVFFNTTSNCRNFDINAKSVGVGVPGHDVQNVNIYCDSLQIKLNYHPGNSKITTNAKSVTCSADVYDILKFDNIRIFKYKTGEPDPVKFKKKPDLMGMLGLDAFNFTNKDVEIRMDTAGSRHNKFMCTIDKKNKMRFSDKAVYELANGWWLHDS